MADGMLENLKTRFKENPRQSRVLLSVLGLGLVLGLLMAPWGGPQWQTYDIDEVGVTVDLPRKPVRTAVPEDKQGDRRLLYEANVEELAVLISGGTHKHQYMTPPLNEMAKRAVIFLSSVPDIDGLRYRTVATTMNGRRALQVTGTFRRRGVHGDLVGAVQCDLAGVVSSSTERHWHVFVLSVGDKGKRTARRILSSAHWTEELSPTSK